MFIVRVSNPSLKSRNILLVVHLSTLIRAYFVWYVMKEGSPVLCSWVSCMNVCVLMCIVPFHKSFHNLQHLIEIAIKAPKHMWYLIDSPGEIPARYEMKEKQTTLPGQECNSCSSQTTMTGALLFTIICYMALTKVSVGFTLIWRSWGTKISMPAPTKIAEDIHQRCPWMVLYGYKTSFIFFPLKACLVQCISYWKIENWVFWNTKNLINELTKMCFAYLLFQGHATVNMH